MSTDEIVAGPLGATSMDPLDARSKPGYKSYRKKYRKMKHQFDGKMRESDNLYREEQRAMDTIKKLEEQNDQLLELLLDLNESTHLPPGDRFDLNNPLLSVDADAVDLAGPSTPLSDSRPLEIPTHSTLASTTLPEDLRASTPPGYLTPSHEEDYLYDLDAKLGLSPPLSRHLAAGGTAQTAKEKDRDSTREAQARNPVSVYNWLRRNQPQVFLQDKDLPPPSAVGGGHGGRGGHERDRDRDPEAASEKSERAAATTRAPKERGAKRASMTPAQVKAEQEYLDEELGGFVAETGTSTGGKGKRKRDDEPYRPKGGSSRPSKRKKDDGTPTVSRRGGRKSGGSLGDGF